MRCGGNGERMPARFFDRVHDMARLGGLFDAASGESACCAVIEGDAGMGKSALLAEYAQRATEGAFAGAQPRIVQTQCHGQFGRGLSYVPVADLLYQLLTAGQPAERPWWRRAAGHAGRAAVRTAPELLSAAVPGLGMIWTAGKEIVEAAVTTTSVPLDSVMPIQLGAVVKVAEAILAAARSVGPVVLVIDDLQYVDASSLMVLDHLVRRLDGSGVRLVVSHTRPRGLDVDDSVAELLDRWVASGVASCRVLQGLPLEAVDELVRSCHPAAPDDLAVRLLDLTLGHPMFTVMCLQEWRPDNADRFVLPDSISKAVERRLEALTPPDRKLLLTAAVHGPLFLSRVVAHAVGDPHDDVLERLRMVAGRHGLIVLEEPPPAWTEDQNTDCYKFENLALWQTLYDLQTREQRRSRHAGIARALTELTATGEPWGWRQQIAYHLARSGAEARLAAAEALYRLAASAAVEGLSFVEAEQYCIESIDLARAAPETNGAARDSRLIAAIELLLSLTEVRWRGRLQPAGSPDVDVLAAEAEAAAARSADPVLLARTALLRGKTLMATEGLVPSLEKLRQAVELASAADDPVVLYVATVEYGRQLSKRDLAAGLGLLRDAERMYAVGTHLGSTADPVLQHTRNLGQMQLAISLYDAGHLSEALGRLEECVARLRGQETAAELPIALNYLAQVYIGHGSTELAKEVLREARSIEESRGGASGWHAYNTALLAFLLSTEPEHRERSRALVEEAWQETSDTWLANLVPIVRNLYAETLLNHAEHSSARDRDELLDQSARLARDTVIETRQTGMVRSEIAAEVLSVRVLLSRGNSEEARSAADRGLALLERFGDMPALRTEEVLYYCAATWHATGKPEEALRLLARAQSQVERKAAGIDDDAARAQFLRIPLNDAIEKGLGGPSAC
jgi:tetratricopeptide (TPR) repeat protein